MKKDDIEASKDIKNIPDTYYYEIQAGDINALIEIEKTLSDVKGIFSASFFHSAFGEFITAIQAAAYYGHNHVIEHLISLGAEFGVEAMIAAIKGGQIETMVYLNQGVPEKLRIAFNATFRKVILKVCFEGGLTFMHIAALYNQPNVMIFLNKDRRVPDVERLPYNVKTARGTTPMHMTAIEGHTEAMFFLNKSCHVPFEQRTSYSVQSNCGTTLMHVAAMTGRNNAMIFLSEDRSVTDQVPYDVKNKTGDNSMHYAAAYGQIETMKFLASKGIRYDVKTNNGSTPMHAATYGQQLETMEFLNSPAVPFNQRTPYGVKTNGGVTPLDIAVAKKYPSTINFLNLKLRQQILIKRSIKVDHNQPIRQGYVLNQNPSQNKSGAVRIHQESQPCNEILRKLEDQSKTTRELHQFKQEISKLISGHTGLRSPSPLTENIQKHSSSYSETNSNNKRAVSRDKVKPTSSVPENNKKQKTACITAGTVKALNSQGFLGQERNRPLDQEVIYAGNHLHPLGGQSLDNLARMANIKIEHSDEENEVDSSMNHGK